jgi:hypothetical protein
MQTVRPAAFFKAMLVFEYPGHATRTPLQLDKLVGVNQGDSDSRWLQLVTGSKLWPLSP